MNQNNHINHYLGLMEATKSKDVLHSTIEKNILVNLSDSTGEATLHFHEIFSITPIFSI